MLMMSNPAHPTHNNQLVGRGWRRQQQKQQIGRIGRLLEDDGQGSVGSGREEGEGGDDDNASCFAFGGGGTPLTMPSIKGEQRQQRWYKTIYAFPGRGTRGGNNGL